MGLGDGSHTVGSRAEAPVYGGDEVHHKLKHCLSILTAETIKIWQFPHISPPILDQYVSQWGLGDILRGLNLPKPLPVAAIGHDSLRGNIVTDYDSVISPRFFAGIGLYSYNCFLQLNDSPICNEMKWNNRNLQDLHKKKVCAKIVHNSWASFFMCKKKNLHNSFFIANGRTALWVL